MATFGKRFFDTANKSKTHNCKPNLSPMILNQLVYCEINEIVANFYSIDKMCMKLFPNFTHRHLVIHTNY